jgi:hypothetical protein
LENKNLKNQKVLVDAMLQVVNSKTTSSSPAAVDTNQKIAELSTKVISAIGTLFIGGLFFVSWWKTRRKPLESVAG